jgi:RNA polymerase sigma factor (sigma-70 family)
MNPQAIDAFIDPITISFTFCFLTWIILTSIRRVMNTKAQAAVQEKLFARIDSAESLAALTSTESGRLFLESLTLEKPEPTSPHRRILTPNLDATLAIRSALQHLKPRERELLWLAYVEGMDHREIAAATGLQPLSIRILLHRARHKAAALLNPTPSAPRSHQP